MASAYREGDDHAGHEGSVPEILGPRAAKLGSAEKGKGDGMITIRSQYHGTSAKVTPRNRWTENTGNASADCAYLTTVQRRRVDKKLCGNANCKCGGILRSDWQVQEDPCGVSIAKGGVA